MVESKYNVLEVRRPDGSLKIDRKIAIDIVELKPNNIQIIHQKTGGGKTCGMAAKAVQYAHQGWFVVIVAHGREGIQLLEREIAECDQGIQPLLVEKVQGGSNEDDPIKREAAYKAANILLTHQTYLGLVNSNPLQNKCYPVIEFLEKDERKTLVLIDEFHEIETQLKWQIKLNYPVFPHDNDDYNDRFTMIKNGEDILSPYVEKIDCDMIYPYFYEKGVVSYEDKQAVKNHYYSDLKAGWVLDCSKFLTLSDPIKLGVNSKKYNKFKVLNINSFIQEPLVEKERQFPKKVQDRRTDPIRIKELFSELFDNSVLVELDESIESSGYHKTYITGCKVLSGFYSRSIKSLFKKDQVIMFTANSDIDQDIFSTIAGKNMKTLVKELEEPEDFNFGCTQMNVMFVQPGLHDSHKVMVDCLINSDSQDYRFVFKTKDEYEKHTQKVFGKYSFNSDVKGVSIGSENKNLIRSRESIPELCQITYSGSSENTGQDYRKYDWTIVMGISKLGIYAADGSEEKRDKIAIEKIRQLIGRMTRGDSGIKNVIFFIENKSDATRIQKALPDIINSQYLNISHIKYQTNIASKMMNGEDPSNFKYREKSNFEDKIRAKNKRFIYPKEIAKITKDETRIEVIEQWLELMPQIDPDFYNKHKKEVEGL